MRTTMTLIDRPETLAEMTAPTRALRLAARADDLAGLRLPVETLPRPRLAPGEALVEVRAAAVNPSDVKAALGMMPYAVFPRTPGRDFAGVVVEGPAEWIGAEVWGSSGDLGIRRDGAHATHLRVDADALRRKPGALSFLEAGSVGVPFVTAWEGLRRAGLPSAGETVAIMGINGKVGQAVAQIATMRGARVIGVARRAEPYAGHAVTPVTMVDASAGDAAEAIRALTDGHGADIVYNTVGEPYWDATVASLAKGGRAVIIASLKQPVAFDLFAFYRARLTLVGIDTLAFSTRQTCDILEALRPGFETGALRPYPIERVVPLAEAAAAYTAVLGAARDRVVFAPNG
jgi:NADPH:quinone reductase-like Zn-dependent oxidoreductase